jgi:hypothetical protein
MLVHCILAVLVSTLLVSAIEVSPLPMLPKRIAIACILFAIAFSVANRAGVF